MRDCTAWTAEAASLLPAVSGEGPRRALPTRRCSTSVAASLKRQYWSSLPLRRRSTEAKTAFECGKLRISWVNCRIHLYQMASRCYKCQGPRGVAKRPTKQWSVRPWLNEHKRQWKHSRAIANVPQLNLNHYKVAQDLLFQLAHEKRPMLSSSANSIKTVENLTESGMPPGKRLSG